MVSEILVWIVNPSREQLGRSDAWVAAHPVLTVFAAIALMLSPAIMGALVWIW